LLSLRVPVAAYMYADPWRWQHAFHYTGAISQGCRVTWSSNARAPEDRYWSIMRRICKPGCDEREEHHPFISVSHGWQPGSEPREWQGWRNSPDHPGIAVRYAWEAAGTPSKMVVPAGKSQ